MEIVECNGRRPRNCRPWSRLLNQIPWQQCYVKADRRATARFETRQPFPLAPLTSLTVATGTLLRHTSLHTAHTKHCVRVEVWRAADTMLPCLPCL